jgi:hypothetical protein
VRRNTTAARGKWRWEHRSCIGCTRIDIPFAAHVAEELKPLLMGPKEQMLQHLRGRRLQLALWP